MIIKNILITGGCGFVGHHIVEHILKNTNWNIIIFDKLTYAASGFDRLRDIKVFNNKRIKIFTVDLQQTISDGIIQEVGYINYVLNLASNSHVDKSISSPKSFILNNVKLMINLLEWFKNMKERPQKIIQFSTDESFGTAPLGIDYKEGSRHNPGNPYSASKACQEDISRAYSNTYNININITHSMNILGERQSIQNFIPLVIQNILKANKVYIHADKTKTIAGSRFYIHARNVAAAILFILDKTNEKLDKIDASKGVFNIVGEKEIDNLSLAKLIAKIMEKPLIYELIDFHSSRPGHDLRYALDGKKLYNYGFRYLKTLEQSLEKTIHWYLKPGNKKWLTI